MNNELNETLDREAQANTEAPAFTVLNLNEIETLLTYQAYRLLLRHFSQQESEPLDNIQQVTSLMATIKPSAVEASKLFAPQGGQ